MKDLWRNSPGNQGLEIENELEGNITVYTGKTQ
jgi:hypothetical protein